VRWGHRLFWAIKTAKGGLRPPPPIAATLLFIHPKKNQ
jgi:hypothetical protein